MNSGPLSEDELLGTPPGLGEAIEDLDHAGAGQRGVHLAGQPLPAERVDYLNVRNFRPVTNRSSMKSMVHRWLSR
jgi:hypothetical protein